MHKAPPLVKSKTSDRRPGCGERGVVSKDVRTTSGLLEGLGFRVPFGVLLGVLLRDL